MHIVALGQTLRRLVTTDDTSGLVSRARVQLHLRRHGKNEAAPPAPVAARRRCVPVRSSDKNSATPAVAQYYS